MKEDMTRRVGITDVATMAFNSIELPLDEQLRADHHKMLIEACGIPAKYLSTDDGASAATDVRNGLEADGLIPSKDKMDISGFQFVKSREDLGRGLTDPYFHKIKGELETMAAYEENDGNRPINFRTKGELAQLSTEGTVAITDIGKPTMACKVIGVEHMKAMVEQPLHIIESMTITPDSETPDTSGDVAHIDQLIEKGVITDLGECMQLPVLDTEEPDEDDFNLDHLDLGDIEPDSYQEQEDDGCEGGACKI